MKVLIINGPNLNLLGLRNPDVYGEVTLEQIELWLKDKSKHLNVELQFFQSNHEGAIIDTIHDAMKWADGIIINPGAFTHYSYAIRDAISAVILPTIEVHLSDIMNREDFRKISVIEPVCVSQIIGQGKFGYLEGLHQLIHIKKSA